MPDMAYTIDRIVVKTRKEGCGEAEAAGSYLWPNGVPNGVTITLLIAVTEPSQVGQFEISGLTFEALQAMEPGRRQALHR
jgi:hypothetical protein